MAGLSVVIRGALVALDITVDFTFTEAPAGDRVAATSALQDSFAEVMRGLLATPSSATIDRTGLQAALGAAVEGPHRVQIQDLHYAAELLEDGLRLLRNDVEIALTDEQPWLRSFRLVEKVAVT